MFKIIVSVLTPVFTCLVQIGARAALPCPTRRDSGIAATTAERRRRCSHAKKKKHVINNHNTLLLCLLSRYAREQVRFSNI